MKVTESSLQLFFQTGQRVRILSRFFCQMAIFMHKVTNGEYLENISSLFVVKNNDNYNLRNNNIDYKLEKPKTNFKKKASAIQV
jgi:hypothetical protein